jgi:hypothetical protein
LKKKADVKGVQDSLPLNTALLHLGKCRSPTTLKKAIREFSDLSEE